METCIRGLDRDFQLIELWTDGFIVGQKALRAASSKVVKDEKVCSDDQRPTLS